MATEKYTLPFQRNIAPLSKLLCVTGGLIPLEYPPCTAGIILCLRYAIILGVGFGVTFVYCFGIFVVVQEIIQAQTVQQFVLTVVKYLTYPLAVTTLITFTKRRGIYLEFLQDWICLEETLDLQGFHSVIPQQKFLRISRISCLYSLFETSSNVYLCVKYADQFPSFGSYVASEWSMTFNVLFGIEMMIYFYAVALSTFGEFVASFVFRHLAFSLVKIQKAFLVDMEIVKDKNQSVSASTKLEGSTNIFTLGNANEGLDGKLPTDMERKTYSYKEVIRKILYRTEHLERLVSQAQSLFGRVLFASYTASFFSTCCVGYFLFLALRSQNSNQTVHQCPNESKFFSDHRILGLTIVNQLALLCKLAIVTNFCSSLPKQLTETQRLLSSTCNQYWDDLLSEERSLFRNTLRHLKLNNWEAAPLDLFSISTSTLLSMFSLITTYVIILLQNECNEMQECVHNITDITT